MTIRTVAFKQSHRWVLMIISSYTTRYNMLYPSDIHQINSLPEFMFVNEISQMCVCPGMSKKGGGGGIATVTRGLCDAY